jgi:hypothetical protein
MKVFALEICPWHSDRFKLSHKDLVQAQTYIEENVLKIAEAAAQKCKYQTIFSVGKDYYNVFKLLDFELIKEVNKESVIIDWPLRDEK